MDISGLKPFSGMHSSLISFSSGHLFRISLWAATPTEFGPFSNVWMVTPEDRRMLYSDPPESERVVRIYHNFHETIGARIMVERPDPMHLDLQMRAGNSTTVQLNLELKRTLMTRLLVSVSRATPIRWKSKEAMIRFADGLTSRFVGGGSMKSAGRTDTDEPFFAADIDDLLVVKDCRATLNGASLGGLCSPRRTVAFGDFGATPRATLLVGRLFLAYPSASARGGAV